MCASTIQQTRCWDEDTVQWYSGHRINLMGQMWEATEHCVLPYKRTVLGVASPTVPLARTGRTASSPYQHRVVATPRSTTSNCLTAAWRWCL